MKTFYKGYTIEVNAQSNGQVIFDVFRGQHHLLAGFQQEGRESNVLETMKQRVDQMILEPPVSYKN